MATTNWWDGGLPSYNTNPVTGQVDYLSALSPSADIANAANTVSTVGSPSSIGGINEWLQSTGIFGSTGADGMKTQGWGSPALSLLSGLGNAYFGAQQLGLAKDSLASQKEQFAQNFAAQRKTTNAALSDRQNARVASNPGAYASVDAYMKQYGV